MLQLTSSPTQEQLTLQEMEVYLSLVPHVRRYGGEGLAPLHRAGVPPFHRVAVVVIHGAQLLVA